MDSELVITIAVIVILLGLGLWCIRRPGVTKFQKWLRLQSFLAFGLIPICVLVGLDKDDRYSAVLGEVVGMAMAFYWVITAMVASRD